MSNLENTNRWEPVDAPLKSSPAGRDPASTRAVAAQFNVRTNPRYAHTADATFCNIFAWDTSRALGCEIPHWVDLDGNPMQSSGRELNVNATIGWLTRRGPAFGWSEVDPAAASSRADMGFPTYALWENPKGHGHIGLCLSGGKVACAGAANVFDAPLAVAFPPYFCKPLRFFTHG